MQIRYSICTCRVSMSFRSILYLFIILLVPAFVNAQDLTQSVHGTVTDAESKTPLPHVLIMPGYLTDKQIVGGEGYSVTDSNGYFTLPNVPVGRQSFYL